MRSVLTRGVQSAAMTALVAAVLLTGTSAEAQRRKKPAQPAQPAPVDLDAPTTPTKGGSSSPAAVGPVAQAGQPTDAAAQAKRLYESEKWWDAAQALFRVSTGETGDDEGNKEIAQFNLAKALYKLKFFQARVLDLQRDRRQAQSPQVQRDAALARQARDRPARAGRHRRARRQVQRAAGRASSTTRSSRTSTGS